MVEKRMLRSKPQQPLFEAPCLRPGPGKWNALDIRETSWRHRDIVETSGSWGSHPVSAASFRKWELSTSACHTREIFVFMERHIDQSYGRSTYDIFGLKGFTHSCIIYA